MICHKTNYHVSTIKMERFFLRKHVTHMHARAFKSAKSAVERIRDLHQLMQECRNGGVK